MEYRENLKEDRNTVQIRRKDRKRDKEAGEMAY